MVVINNDLVDETSVTLWYDDGVARPVEVGVIKNAIALNDVRLQIARGNMDGYYIMFNDRTIRINRRGKLELWPMGLFTLIDEQLDELCSIMEDKC